MMFKDRDLGLLGAGALLAVCGLLLPLPWGGKVASGLVVLVGFGVWALLRVGPDRIPLEVWLWRRLRFWLQTRRYTYQQAEPSHPRPRGPGKRAVPAPVNPPAVSPDAHSQPVVWAVAEVGVYPVVTVLLAVLGIDFLVWLVQGGTAELAGLLGGIGP